MPTTRRAKPYAGATGTNRGGQGVEWSINRTMLKTDQDTDDAPSRREGDVTSALASHPPLTAADRCDRCGAQAYIRANLATGGELLFCAHHGHAHETKLRELAAEIHDDSSQLVGTPALTPEVES